MELNREQIVIEIQSIIKALKVNNGRWENRGRGGWFNHDILEDALALIKELTEEVADLKAIAEQYQKQFEEAKTDTVREFAEKLKRYYNELSGKTFPPLVAYHIEQIEKEFLCDSET